MDDDKQSNRVYAKIGIVTCWSCDQTRIIEQHM